MLDIFGCTAHSNINSIPKNPIAGLIWDSRNMNLDPGRPENSRDTVRRVLHLQAPHKFPIGHRSLLLDDPLRIGSAMELSLLYAVHAIIKQQV
jgi:hypothetical protein